MEDKLRENISVILIIVVVLCISVLSSIIKTRQLEAEQEAIQLMMDSAYHQGYIDALDSITFE